MMGLKVLKVLLALISAAVFLSGASAADGDTEGDIEVRGEGEGRSWVKGCLHGDNVVQTTYGNKLVRHLNIGDKVATVDASANPKYEPVSLDLHRNEKALSLFCKIHTENRELMLTPQHLVYIGDSIKEGKLVASDEVRVGDEVMVNDGGNVHVEMVTKVSRFTDVGIYNPVVASGRMFVGGILASNYVNCAPFTATHQHYSIWILRLIDNVIPGFMAYNNKLLETNINYIVENVAVKAYSKLF